MHFGHPRTTTAFKNQNLLKIWVFQGFPYTRLGPDLVILSPFWGIKFQNSCKKCPSHGEKNLKIFLFFKNVPNSPRMHFGRLKTIRNLQKHMIIPSKGDWQCLGQTLNLHKFWSNKDFHMIFYSRESWNFIFLDRRNFCQKFLECSRIF